MAAQASALQLAANRANALLSTGPKTEAGRLASSANSLSHGLTTRHALLPGENLPEYESHHETYQQHYRPRNPIAVQMVTELADIQWRLLRVPAFEAQLFSLEFRNLKTNPELKPLIEKLDSDQQILAVAFTRLVESKVLPNLLNQEARLSRRADKLRRELESTAYQPQRIPQPDILPDRPSLAEEIENLKNEAIQLAHEVNPQPVRVNKVGRNESCPCNSGLKFKRCCLNKPSGSVTAAA